MGRTVKRFGGEEKIIATYSEKEQNKSFVLRQTQEEIKVGDDDFVKPSHLEKLVLTKLRKISNEDKNDVIKYLFEKDDI